MKDSVLIISEKEKAQLMEWMAAYDPPDLAVRQSLERLSAELAQADVRAEENMPSDVVRLNSTVAVDMPTGRKSGLRLVPHDQADLKAGRISVLSVLGSALIGYPQGAVIQWKMPKGDMPIELVTVDNNA